MAAAGPRPAADGADVLIVIPALDEQRTSPP